MNYEPNKTRWKLGDLVLHDADAKEPGMLMRVVGYDRAGKCITVYLVPGGLHSRRLRNKIEDLHDPARFEVDVEEASGEEGRRC